MSTSTKSTKSAATATPPAVAEQTKPGNLTLMGPTITTLAKAAALIREGYVPSLTDPLDVFGVTGQISIHLELGDPRPEFIDGAKADMAEALVLEGNRHQLEIAARRLVKEQERAEKQAALAAKIAEHEASLRALQAEAAAA